MNPNEYSKNELKKIISFLTKFIFIRQIIYLEERYSHNIDLSSKINIVSLRNFEQNFIKLLVEERWATCPNLVDFGLFFAVCELVFKVLAVPSWGLGWCAFT